MKTDLPFACSLCVMLWSFGCHSGPEISEYGRQPYERIFSAPLVIVGVADSDVRVGGTRPSRTIPNYPMQLHRVQVRVENVLRGELPDQAISVYYFAFAGGIDGPRPLGFGRAESRRILWLRRDSGVLRMACDGWDECSMFVESGAHPGYASTPGWPLPYAMADILLTRGQGHIDQNRFAKAIAWGGPGTIPEYYLVEKYFLLALTEKAAVKTAACSQLWMYAQAVSPNRQDAARGLANAGCRCANGARGEPRCE